MTSLIKKLHNVVSKKTSRTETHTIDPWYHNRVCTECRKTIATPIILKYSEMTKMFYCERCESIHIEKDGKVVQATFKED